MAQGSKGPGADWTAAQRARLGDRYNRYKPGGEKTLGEYRAWLRAQERKKRRGVGMVEHGDTLTTLGDRYGVSEGIVAGAMENDELIAGTVLDFSQSPRGPGGYKGQEESPKPKASMPDFYDPDFNPNVPPKFNTPQFDPGDPSAEGIYYPEGYNPDLFSEFLGELGGGAGYDVQGDYGARFWSPTAFGGVENIDDLIAANQRYWEAAQASSRLTDYGTAWSKRNISEESAYARKWETGDMFELPGMSVQNRWEVDSDTGKMKRKHPESAIDALYEENGIDPNDPDMVEYFWGFADDALLQMGEFFDVIEWPSGGGYGGGYEEYPYPPYVTSSMPGQKPRRGDYDSYLSLTSWSI